MADRWFEGDVVTNGVRLHYYRTGGDRPPLVLSHGITDNGLGWSRVARALEANYDVVMVDARGHGRSEKPPSDYAYQTIAADLAGLLHALSIRRPALLGHSMGSHVSMILAAAQPEMPAALILEDPAFRPTPFTVNQGLDGARRHRAQMADYKSLSREQLSLIGHREHPGLPADEVDHWVDSVQQVSLDIFNPREVFQSYAYTSWQELVPKILCPILLITGDPARGALTPPDGAQMAARLWRSGTVRHVEGCGHVIRRDHFERYIAILKDWLNTHYPA